MQFRNLYFIKKEAGEWTTGTIVSDSTAAIIAFAETNDVSSRSDDDIAVVLLSRVLEIVIDRVQGDIRRPRVSDITVIGRHILNLSRRWKTLIMPSCDELFLFR